MKARVSFKHFERVEKGVGDDGYVIYDEKAKTAVFDIELLSPTDDRTVIVASFDRGGHHPPLRLPVDGSFNLAGVKGAAIAFACSVGHGVNEPDVEVFGMPEEV
jgi:hypothetical protein